MNRFTSFLKSAIFLILASAASSSHAQTFTTLHSFNGTDGSVPVAPLTLSPDGRFYGTTSDGGPESGGTVFVISPPGGTFRLLDFFSAGSGQYPNSPLIQRTDGGGIGVTPTGGGEGNTGTIYRVARDGRLQVLHDFTAYQNPFGIIQARDGNFYGTTEYPTLFRLTPSGAFTSFNLGGDGPIGSIVQGFDGNFYGTSSGGGPYQCGSLGQCGTVFSITTHGAYVSLHDFMGSDGGFPNALIQGNDGNFYGTTSSFGPNGNQSQGGTVFRITPTGTLTTLYDFCALTNCADGNGPGPLTQGSDGNFYGITTEGGANGLGTIFSMTPAGVLTTLHSFSGVDGEFPLAGLTQGPDGVFYGTTSDLNLGNGTIFSLSVGLGPFVQPQPSYGEPGATINIVGTSLYGTSSVAFNGTPASFAVKSKSHIVATVPAGASTGFISVISPNGPLSSNVPFQVLP